MNNRTPAPGLCQSGLSPTTSFRFSTDDVPLPDRRSWLREVIGREYTHVDITPPVDGKLFNEMTIYPWQNLQLSKINSSSITLQRLPHEPESISQDAYFAVILLAGQYHLQQNGREVFLQAGDISLYDATLPHRIECPDAFSKLLISIPRSTLRDRVGGIEQCTALHIPGQIGIGAITANFIRSAAVQTGTIDAQDFSALAEYALDLLTMAITAVRPANFNLSRSRVILLNRIKDFVEHHLADSTLDAAMVSDSVGLSVRYLNDLFNDEDTSLVRYIWQRRLEHCALDMRAEVHIGHSLTDIALRWGFNDMSHFSRSFKSRFGCPPRDYRQYALCPDKR
ncbi:MAG: helix-turn-helix domain-containing protein [Methylococcales bacterium]|nr:helix-turn-helix domain-containing protein [Methylococcales bacterium]